MYDREWYDSLRTKYGAISLLSVYEKVKFDPEAEQRAANPSLAEGLMGSWPFSGCYGIKKVIESGAHLQAKTSAWKSMGETDRFGMRR